MTTTPDQATTELKPGDRVQLDDQGLPSDYGTVIEPPKLMYPNDPGPRVRVEVPYIGTRTYTPLVSEVRPVPADEEQQIWLQRWVVTGEQICDDPDEYNHPHMLFVHESDLPEIIRTYLAANGLTAPGTTPAAEPVEPSGLSELEQYAADLMLEHARGVESLSVFEMADEHLGRPITDDEAEDVLALINRAEVVVGFRDQDTAG